MDGLVLIVLVVLLLLIMPVYAYLLSKFAQVGRMAGARWFAKNCNRRK